MVNHLSIKHIFTKKRILSLLIALLTTFLFNTKTQAQEFVYGFTGGLNMNTIYSKNNESGLKMGLNIGGLAQYRLDNTMSITANIKFSSKGQQYSKVINTPDNYFKTYHTTSLYYIDIPILYQYSIQDIIGVEAGPSFNFCLGGKDKSKEGNSAADITKLRKGDFNPFEFGLVFGIFTRDLGQNAFNNIFIEFRYFLGLTNVIKSEDYGRNTNGGVFLNVCYIIENPLKKKLK
jgi:hypothetical protein